MERPYPSKAFIEKAQESLISILSPAPELKEWVNEQIISDSGEIHNPDHWHLEDADIEFMWATTAFAKKGKTVLGQCEQLMFRAGGWQKVRQEQQFYEWFGRVPKFIITLAADYCMQCNDNQFCSLVEHELYHLAHEHDAFDQPKFTQGGLPRLTMASHDVEEFIGVVKRYGPSEEVKELALAAIAKPEVAKTNIVAACGTCLRVVA